LDTEHFSTLPGQFHSTENLASGFWLIVGSQLLTVASGAWLLRRLGRKEIPAGDLQYRSG
jgi:hypothetical protein